MKLHPAFSQTKMAQLCCKWHTKILLQQSNEELVLKSFIWEAVARYYRFERTHQSLKHTQGMSYFEQYVVKVPLPLSSLSRDTPRRFSYCYFGSVSMIAIVGVLLAILWQTRTKPQKQPLGFFFLHCM